MSVPSTIFWSRRRFVVPTTGRSLTVGRNLCEKSSVKTKPILEYKRYFYCSGGSSICVVDGRTSRPAMGATVFFFLSWRFALKLRGLIQDRAPKFGGFGQSVVGVVEITRGFRENRPRPDTGCAPKSPRSIDYPSDLIRHFGNESVPYPLVSELKKKTVPFPDKCVPKRIAWCPDNGILKILPIHNVG